MIITQTILYIMGMTALIIVADWYMETHPGPRVRLIEFILSLALTYPAIWLTHDIALVTWRYEMTGDLFVFLISLFIPTVMVMWVRRPLEQFFDFLMGPIDRRGLAETPPKMAEKPSSFSSVHAYATQVELPVTEQPKGEWIRANPN